MKPTPGPWRAQGGAIRPESAKRYTGGYAPILSAQHDKRLPDNREANARLAAAAPELLEALQWLMRQVPEPKPRVFQLSKRNSIEISRLDADALKQSSPQREWVGLTEEEFQWCANENWPMVRVAEMLKEKNT